MKKNRDKNKKVIEELIKKNEELKKEIEDQRNVIGDLKKKNEDEKYAMMELKTKHDAEKKAIVALKKSKAKNEYDYEKSKNEIQALKKKFTRACEEINELARLVNIYG